MKSEKFIGFYDLKEKVCFVTRNACLRLIFLFFNYSFCEGLPKHQLSILAPRCHNALKLHFRSECSCSI